MASSAVIGRSGTEGQGQRPPLTAPLPATPSYTVEQPLLLALAIAAVLMTLAWLARTYLIEPETIAHACVADPRQGLCGPRALLIASFSQQGLGWLALISGALSCVLSCVLSYVVNSGFKAVITPVLATSGAVPAAIRSERALAWLAWCSGCVGLVLYCYEFAAVGAITGLLVLLKR